ncbi:hypothetical protein DENIS_0071 [Desulfonema ishimotonii]|uniref:UspA domain-containing protein n=1 Tax=Desulfonema ishimotonii TaxID=45657 RepID=A0A401FQJ7_9BACT|nr:universal stress protein [Desulfonema ishimotonii]GBC59135.1 hypothetical protein DENIS_0071 [Desulfonema ishimotonii]
MKKIRKIMVGYDMSEYSAEALRYAVGLAENMGAELFVVNVINQRDIDAIQQISLECSTISVPKWIENTEKERSEATQELIDQVRTEAMSIRKIFCIGVPFAELVRAIGEHNVDLMVMGTKGRSNLAGVLFGTTAEKMFRKCPVPLLSIRKPPCAED